MKESEKETLETLKFRIQKAAGPVCRPAAFFVCRACSTARG